MGTSVHTIAAKVGLVSLAALALIAAQPMVAPAQLIGQARMGRLSRTVGRENCPCAASAFFASFLNGQRQLLACTNNTPVENFVRLVDSNVDLVVLFEFPPQMYCGWQPDGDYTSFLPVTARQFDACKRLIVRAAAEQGLRCVPELP
jgi:hypothetical protein